MFLILRSYDDIVLGITKSALTASIEPGAANQIQLITSSSASAAL